MPTVSTRVPKRPDKQLIFFARIALILLLCLAVGFLGGLIAVETADNDTNNTTETQQQIVSSESELNSTIAKNVSPSVVSISVESESTSSYFFGSYTSESAGTGIIISADGYIVTNKHVIPDNATEVAVTLSDGTRYDDVTVVGRDPRDSMDVAFLKINGAKDLKAAKLGDSSKVEVGEKVVAIGNALGEFQNTVTTGIISGLGRPVTASDNSGASAENLSNLFQTDAAINAGNSGGPLVNVNSEVIGINTAVASNAENIGFAIPINDIRGLVATVLEKGKLEVPYLGVRYIDLTDSIADELGVEAKRGAYIYSSDSEDAILSGSPAEKAGLKEEDVITKVNDVAIDENTKLSTAIAQFKVGDTVTLTIIRDGAEQKMQATLEAAD